jgi:Tat protein secretion system quality control protein TatD with DNase activity
MIITIKYFGVTYSIETKTDDLNATEILETFTNLMRCIGFHPNSIDGAIMELNEQIDL